jgi:hypothetical protein
MMGRDIANCGLRIADCWKAMGLACTILVVCGSPVRAETDAQRAARLRQLTVEQKDELLSKKKRYDQLAAEEKDRLHGLHVSIESAANSRELLQTLERYHAWLATLSPAQRDELRDLSADKRIERIRELLKQQEAQRFQAFVGNLGESDRQAIFKWLGDFVMQHEDEILEQLQDRERREIRGQPNPEIRQRMLGFQMAIHRQNPKMPAPGHEDLNKLLASLTAETLAQIEQAPALEQPERVREMVRAAIFSRRIPPVSDGELRKYYAGLKTDQRERLEGLESEEFKRRLTWMYHAEKSGYRSGGGPPRWSGFSGGFGPPGPGRPGEGRPGEGSRGDGRRGDGKRGGPPDRRPDGLPAEGERPQPPPMPPSDP